MSGTGCLGGDGCIVDHDGTHYCRATVGELVTPSASPSPRAVVEVTRTVRPDGTASRPRVWLLPVGRDDYVDGDGLVVDRATATQLGVLLDRAPDVAAEAGQ